jgi:uroporphyrin-3 C-methyltransferase
MANNEEKQGAGVGEVLDAEVLEAEVVKEAAPPKGRGNVIAVLACLLSLLACAAAGWLWWAGQQQQRQWGSDLDSYSRDLQNSQQQLSVLQGKLTGLSQQVLGNRDELAVKLSDFERALRGQRTLIQSLSHTDRTDWQLAEVEYLLRLANQRLLMAGEPQGARALLERADSLLRELDDLALHSARRAIAEDLAALRAVKDLDVEGLYLKLEALAKQADELVFYKVPEVAEGSQLQESGKEESAQTWWQQVQSVWSANLQKIKQFVVIQHRDETVQALPSMARQQLVRQQMQVLFDQAQLALLRAEQTIYEDSLHAAAALVEKYYVLDNASSRAVLETIAETSAITVSPDLPDISGSLNAIKNHIAQLHSVPEKPGVNAQPGAARSEEVHSQ